MSEQLKRKKTQLKTDESPHQRSNALLKDRKILAEHGYFIGRKLDSGTFAVVRYAEKTSNTGTLPLAVKVIDKAKASPVFTEKFLLRELSIWPKLHHRHIIQVENICYIQDRVYVFMELAQEGSVIDYLQRHGAVDEAMGRIWCKRMCQALQYCHNKGIAHRDLKCDNLLLDKDLNIKIGDFGFSCRSVDRYRDTPVLSDTYCGSLSYVAPEVIEGKKPYDPIPADVWSAGVCIYVILNNAMPFDDSNALRMHEDQVKGRWAFSPEVDSKLSKSAKKLVVKMLDPVVETRPIMYQVLNTTWMKNPLPSISSFRKK